MAMGGGGRGAGRGAGRWVPVLRWVRDRGFQDERYFQKTPHEETRGAYNNPSKQHLRWPNNAFFRHPKESADLRGRTLLAPKPRTGNQTANPVPPRPLPAFPLALT